MEKSFFVNLGSRVFQIDEAAYTMLDTYISTIREHYADQDPDGEIVQDFESRLSDILWEKSEKLNALVTTQMTKEAIAQLGPLEEVIAEEIETAPHTATTHAAPSSRATPERKLYRDPQNKWLGGVLGGFSAYFGFDPIFVRLLFILLQFTPVNWVLVILYLAFWIFLPPAVTVQQRLEMEGRPVSSTELWRKITEEAEGATRRLKSRRKDPKGTDPADSTPKKKDSPRRTTLYWIVGLLVVVAVVLSLIWALHGLSTGLFFDEDYWYGFAHPHVGPFVIPLIVALGFFLLILLIGLLFVVVILPIGLIIRSSASPAVKGVAILGWLIFLGIVLI